MTPRIVAIRQSEGYCQTTFVTGIEGGDPSILSRPIRSSRRHGNSTPLAIQCLSSLETIESPGHLTIERVPTSCQPAISAHGLVEIVVRTRAPAQCSDANDPSMKRLYHSVMVNTLVERNDATWYRQINMHTSRSIASTSTVREVGLSTSTERSER